MKHAIPLSLALLLLCAVLAGCVAGAAAKETEAESSPSEYQEQTVSFEEVTGPTSPLITTPPAVTVPTQPEADYTLPPGEVPGSNRDSK